MKLEDMTPKNLKDAPKSELLSAWRRLHEWYANAKEHRNAVEDYVNAAIFLMNEFKKRGISFDEKSPLVHDAKDLKKSIVTYTKAGMKNLPMETVLVKDFVSIVGSFPKGKAEPNDVDVLVRAETDKNDKNFLIQAENVWLPVRNALDPEKRKKLSFLTNPQGAHGDNIPLYDLVLRRRKDLKTVTVKSMQMIDIGCGPNKKEGFIGIDKAPKPGVDILANLEDGIPMPDGSCQVVRAYHSLEHLADKTAIMREISRVLAPGGELQFEVPSTMGEGAFNHPDHKSYWNKTSFAFYTQDHLLEGRPKFDMIKLEERKDGDLVYVEGVLRKPDQVQKEKPFQQFDPPKPMVAGFTELFHSDELWKWAENKLPIQIEPKFNGFRAVLQKKGDRVALWFEGQFGKDQLHKFPKLKSEIERLPGDLVMDGDLTLRRDGKKVPRIDLATLNSTHPEIADNEKLVFTVFDAPYIDEELGNEPLTDRQEKMADYFSKHMKGSKNFEITEWRTVNSRKEMDSAIRWAFGKEKTEGLVAKVRDSKYPSGGTAQWSKLKKAVELKVIVMGKNKTKAGNWNYKAGLLPAKQFKNTVEFNGKSYIDLGNTFNTDLNADPGDILTVGIIELIVDLDQEQLSWVGPRVTDVDDTRRQPYAAQQAIDIARRGGVLQEEKRVSKEMRVLAAAMGIELVKAQQEGGDPGQEMTRGQAAETFFRGNWPDLLPSSGNGRFVYHHHWRGLEKDKGETSLTDAQLMAEGNHSVHGDLRMEGNDGLWGWAILIGKAKDNVPDEKFLTMQAKQNIRLAPKLRQPKEWLNVGVKKPYLSEPGGVGSTSLKWSKFFALDHGTYEMGYAKNNLYEVFLKGSKLKGRYLIEGIPTESGRVWNITKPEDQTPAIDRPGFDLLADYKKNKAQGEDVLYVARPGMKPVIIDLKKDTEADVLRIADAHGIKAGPEKKPQVAKAVGTDEEKRIVYGVVLEPEVVDAQGDIISKEDIEKTAHDYMLNHQTVGYGHVRNSTAKVVESFIAPVSFRVNGVNGNDTIKKGSWVMAVHIPSDKEWAEVKEGKIQAFSIGGTGNRRLES